MHIAFVDIVYGYTADRPDSAAPLGGTTSAICFLARELVKAGVSCTFFNKIKQPGEAHGIRSLPIEMLIDERSNPDYSAFIVSSRWSEWLINHIREKAVVPIIAWVQESTFSPPLISALPAFDGVVFISEWHQRINQKHVLPHWRQTVIRNAMNPKFAGLYPPGAPIMEHKAKPPVLLYAGATPRGAFHLPALLDALRPRRTDFSMEIYCDCMPSRDAEANGKYLAWMRSLPNVTHVGMVPQAELVQRMKRAALLVSPNPWPETSCIALIEAMASGLCAITTNRAVLPETGAGFPQHIEIEDVDHPTRFDMSMPYDKFAAAIDTTMTRWLEDPLAMERSLRTQVDYFNDRYQWSQRVQPWIEFIRSFARNENRVVRA